MSSNPPSNPPANPPPDHPPANLLSVTLKHRAGSLSLDLSFALTHPWTILFGPSGSGKTTVLRTIAGFVRPDAGEIVYGPMERTLLSTKQGLSVPAHKRPVRTAGQIARLFLQLSVRDNVLYGMRQPQARSKPEREVLADVMNLMRLTSLADRRPDTLSGGERQRVSVARALASAVTFDGPDKALLLLDEPFTGLDTSLRDELAVSLRDWLARRKVPVLSVSHDVAECHILDAEVIRIGDGHLISQGPAAVVLASERARLLSRLGCQSHPEL